MASNAQRPDIESSTWIARAPEDIWKFLSAISTDTQWRTGVTDAKWISKPPYGVGSTGLHIIEGIGDWPWTVSEFEEPYVMAWEVTGGRFEGSHGAYRIEPKGDGSHFTIETRFKRSILMRLLALLLKGTIKRGNATDLEKLKAILEAQAASN
jgi:hypothetical protein